MDYTNLRDRFRSPQWTGEQERILLEPFTYLASTPGKEIRSHLIDAFNIWLCVPEVELGIIRNVVRLLHNASLLMDDVEDGSELRRGIPVSHTIFGIPQTINTANYVYFLAFEELLKLRSPTPSPSRPASALGGLSAAEVVKGVAGGSTAIGEGKAGEPSTSASAAAAVVSAATAAIGMGVSLGSGMGSASTPSPASGPSSGSVSGTGSSSSSRTEPVGPVFKGDVNGQVDTSAISASESANGSGSTSRDGKGKGVEKDLDLVPMVIDELLNLHRGQGLDLFWRDSLTCPTEEEYVHMVLGKTGGLFRLAVKLMMAKSTSNIDYVPLVNLISIYFQIRDDYMNLQSDQYADNKGYCEDLTEGKFSFPVVHGVRADPSNRQILNVLQKRTTSRSLKAHTVEYLRSHTHSFDYTLTVLADVLVQIEAEIKDLGGNPGLEKIIEMLYVPQRPAAAKGTAAGMAVGLEKEMEKGKGEAKEVEKERKLNEVERGSEAKAKSQREGDEWDQPVQV